jgi:trypanothione synthetase/amidase
MAFFQQPNELPVGDIQGYAPGNIPAYSNGSDYFFTGERNFDDGLFTGFKWQCVEFARRWLLERKNLILPDIPWAVHIFNMKSVKLATDGSDVPAVSTLNGTTSAPEGDALLIWPSMEDSTVGHVAAIVEVGDGYVRVADQNHTFTKWTGNYSQELKVTKDADGKYHMVDADGIAPIGWVSFPSVPVRDASQPVHVHESLKNIQYPEMELERITFIPKPTEGEWLDRNDPAQAKFIETFGTDLNRSRLSEQESNYYRMNMELMLACVNAGTQLHRMSIEATRKVLSDDALLARFGIPEVFWGRIKRSFVEQPYAISGRFDFALSADGKQLKMFEYNADSASTLLECGVIQDKWATAVGLDNVGRSTGFRCTSLLNKAWSDVVEAGAVKKGALVHFLVDKDDEEQYTALYMMSAAQKAGLKTKLVIMLDTLQWKDGVMCDEDGEPLRVVWKTWAWETVISDWHNAQEEDAKISAPGSPVTRPNGAPVRLSDVFLGDDTITFYEPLWKVIPSNKAILPVLWEMYPNHPNLLRTEWEITDELRATGYARKPIVGRCGKNITICDPAGTTLKESHGEFNNRDLVYQELFQLQKRDEYFGILGGWMLGAYYGGTGLREDKSIITNVESPFSAIRVTFNDVTTRVLKPISHDDAKEEHARLAESA